MGKNFQTEIVNNSPNQILPDKQILYHELKLDIELTTLKLQFDLQLQKKEISSIEEKILVRSKEHKKVHKLRLNFAHDTCARYKKIYSSTEFKLKQTIRFA